MRALFLFYLILTTGLICTRTAQAEGKKPVILELFTTQGCSACPPADRFTKELSDTDQDVIILSCHVTYFDHRAWKDTLSQEFCNGRHRGYHDALNLPRIGTPQFVINGLYDTTGVNENTILSGIKMARSLPDLGVIELAHRPGFLDVTLPKTRLTKGAEIWLVAYDPLHRVRITAGDNADITGEYVNAAKHLIKLMNWHGGSQSMSYPLGGIETEGYAVLAQYRDHGGMIAVGTIKVLDQE